MPPIIKITGEAILDAAIEIIREKGVDAVNARELAKALECSVQPIFRSFESMDNLKKQLYRRAETIYYDTMAREVEHHGIPFLGKSLAYIEFANEERNLYKFLFQSGAAEGGSIFDRIRAEQSQAEIDTISGMTGLSAQHINRLFEDTWLITHGLAALVAASPCKLGEEEIVRILNVLAESFMRIRNELSSKKAEKR